MLRLRVAIWLVVIVALTMLQDVFAQAPRNPVFRTLRYEEFNGENVIYGQAVEGAIIQVYAVSPGSCSPSGPPLASVVSQYTNGWVFSGLPVGKYVVSMTVNGIETFESQTLAEEEFRVEPDCAMPATLSIRYGRYGNYAFRWFNERNELVGNNSVLQDAPPGIYHVEYTAPSGCVFRSPRREVRAPATVADQTLKLACGASTVNVQAQYTTPGINSGYSFLWQEDATNREISTSVSADLAAGRYYLTVTSPSGCASNRALIVVEPNSPLASINTSGMVRIPANCGQSNGAITGITTTAGANATYRWTGTKGQEYHTLDISGIPPDTYTLEVYDQGSFCPTRLTNIVVGEVNAISIDLRGKQQVQTSCGLNNGSITGISVSNATSYRWYNVNTGATVSNDLDLRDAAPGYYRLELTNSTTGCMLESSEFHIQETYPSIVMVTSPVVQSDQCGLSNGSVTGAVFNTPIKRFNWMDETGKEIGNAKDLTGVTSGVYKLLAVSEKCSEIYTFTVGEVSTALMAPIADDIRVCVPSEVLLNLSAQTPATLPGLFSYRIYDPEGVLLMEQEAPLFRVRIDREGQYAATIRSGDCESPRTVFDISFGSPGIIIPNAFSPNNDGKNDLWVIRGLDTYINPEVRVYNRYGDLVYHKKGQSSLFDGQFKGRDLPAGVYYYTVKASDDCPLLSGSLTIFR